MRVMRLFLLAVLAVIAVCGAACTGEDFNPLVAQLTAADVGAKATAIRTLGDPRARRVLEALSSDVLDTTVDNDVVLSGDADPMVESDVRRYLTV